MKLKHVMTVVAVAAVLVGCDTATMPTAIDEAVSAGEMTARPDNGSYIVVLKESAAQNDRAANQARAAEVARGLGLSPVHTYGAVFVGFSATIPEGRLDALRNDPRVAHVDVDAPVSLPNPRAEAKPPWAGGGDGGSSAQEIPWGIARIGADVNTNEGAGIHVYVIDTGIDADHPDLQANLGNGYAVETCKGGSCLAAWDDDEGHGTHVSGTIGAIDNEQGVLGVASQVTLHAVKVLAKNGMGSRSGVIAGVDWVTSEVANRGQAAVANMSLGGSGSKSGSCTDSGFTGTDSYHQAICNSRNAGVVYAVAAGNDGADAAGAVPAAYDDVVITVSATSNPADWPYWSNYGDDTAAWTPHVSAPVAIAAPGASVLSLASGGGTTTMSGTSMASPHVAGAAALVLASSTQAADGSAFSNVRAALLAADESTDSWSNTSGRVHNEDFLNASGL